MKSHRCGGHNCHQWATLLLIVACSLFIPSSLRAATAVFNIDSANSSFTASSRLLNNQVTVTEQKSGSLTSILAGQITADYTNSTFTFNAATIGASVIDHPLHPQTPFAPSGASWSGEDNYGGKFTIPFFGSGNMAGRDLTLTIDSGSAAENGPVTGLKFLFTSGRLDVDSNIHACPPNNSQCKGTIDMTDSARNSAFDTSSSPFTSTVVNNVQTITIPVHITAQFSLATANDSTFELQGQIRASRNLPQPLDGDFNHDDRVDAADYVVWRKGNGPASDYTLWRSNFGRVQTAAAGAIGPSTVPEPGAMLSWFACAACIVYVRRASRSCQMPF